MLVLSIEISAADCTDFFIISDAIKPTNKWAAPMLKFLVQGNTSILMNHPIQYPNIELLHGNMLMYTEKAHQ